CSIVNAAIPAEAAATEDAPIAMPFHFPLAAGPVSRGLSPCLYEGSASALANACAPVNRSAGSFSRAFRMAASTLKGIDLRTAVADTGTPW
ncbi:MAG: hypothetical protein O2992_15270, partial [Gemmatimonadetes bacterium]|nr:hypothetical protein [Gemmatimonadota bacterium]